MVTGSMMRLVVALFEPKPVEVRGGDQRVVKEYDEQKKPYFFFGGGTARL